LPEVFAVNRALYVPQRAEAQALPERVSNNFLALS